MIAVGDEKIEAFVAMMDEAGSAHLLSCPGCHSVRVLPGVENPGKVLFLVEWDSAEAHTAARSSDGFAAFIRIASPFFPPEGGGTMEHFRLR